MVFAHTLLYFTQQVQSFNEPDNLIGEKTNFFKSALKNYSFRIDRYKVIPRVVELYKVHIIRGVQQKIFEHHFVSFTIYLPIPYARKQILNLSHIVRQNLTWQVLSPDRCVQFSTFSYNMLYSGPDFRYIIEALNRALTIYSQ
ncbi:hypothetical protein NQ317_015489, partial [Molorchus minor]